MKENTSSPARLRWVAMLLLCAANAGCSGWQSALDDHGAEAERLAHLIWLIIAVCAAIWVLVTLVLALSLWRRRPPRANPLTVEPTADRRLTGIVATAIALSIAVVALLTLVSFFATRGLSETTADPLKIRVRGYQWWWEVSYPSASPGQTVTTANELHVPVGRQVEVELSSEDVIHSFWVPSLAGKLDLIPGRTNILTVTALRPGIYRGQCAEFCGVQHAHMSFVVIAENPTAFEAWRRAQTDAAQAPSTPEEEAGRRVFIQKSCSDCHTIKGTPASARLGPDLTHVGSRRYIGAGLMETTRGSLAAWIADPQTLKPGNNMPMVPLSANELRAVSAYLASLK